MNRNTDFIPFAQPAIGRSEIRAVKRVLRSGWLTTGAESLSFEKEFAAALESHPPRGGAPLQALAMNSATSGLHLSLEALGVGPGDLVALPTLTFTATAEILRYLGADPVFVDVEYESGNMDVDRLAEAVAETKVRAVIPVHLAGRPCRMPALLATARSVSAVVVEDASHAFPSRLPEGAAGTLGDAGVFSFYVTKTITTGEGGMVVTRRKDLLERMHLMRFHGIDRAVWDRQSSKAQSRSWEYDVKAAGYKYNLMDMSAAIGRVQLRRAEELWKQRRLLSLRYRQALASADWLELPKDENGHAWHLFIVRLREGDRDAVMRSLQESGIGSSVHFIPLHRMTYWKERYKLHSEDFPVAEDLFRRSFSLPLWPGMSHNSQKRVIKALLDAGPYGKGKGS